MDARPGLALLGFTLSDAPPVQSFRVKIEPAAIRRLFQAKIEHRFGASARVDADQEHPRNVPQVWIFACNPDAIRDLLAREPVVESWRLLRCKLCP